MEAFRLFWSTTTLKSRRRNEKETKSKIALHLQLNVWNSRRIQWWNVENQLAASFLVYADLESIFKNLEDNKYQENVTCSHAYHIVSNIPGVGLNAVDYI